jgi:hypothetical protein
MMKSSSKIRDHACREDVRSYVSQMHPGASSSECRSLSSFHWLRAAIEALREPVGTRIFFVLVLVNTGLVFAQPCGASGRFENTGSLAAARYGHTATLLPNGNVLVVGGLNATTIYPAAEIYAPEVGAWTATGNPTTTRFYHTATLLSNGKVLVAAGAGPGYDFASAELYDPASGTWTVTGSLSTERDAHTATLLPNGKVLVAAGYHEDFGYGGFSLSTAELYDPASGTWTVTGSLSTARRNHTATLLPNGKVLVAGGTIDNISHYEILASAELYDPASGAWTSTGSLATARDAHTATLLPNGKVLVAGGISYPSGSVPSAELYDPASETWTPTGALVDARAVHTATLLHNGKVLVAGGYGNLPGSLPSAELYDPASGTWTSTGSLIFAREIHTATLLPNDEVLVAGGRDVFGASQVLLASAELYITPPNLLNISTRLPVETGDNAMIGGFIITGTQPKTVIVRGIGPSLAMPGALADPVIEVHGASGELLATNDNWRDDPNQQHVIDSGLAPTNDLESALWGTINPGAYTVVVRGKNDTTGIALVEVYDLDQAVDSQLANISTRGPIETNDNVLIGGVIVGSGSGGATTRVMLRALGPSVPIEAALGDPTLELHDESGNTVAFNDNWKTRPDGSSQQAEIEATGIPPTNDLESALLQTLPAGNYTAIVRGMNGTTGVGLLEAYNLP